MSQITKTCIFITLVSAVASAPLVAKDSKDDRISQAQIAEVLACRSISEESERVACYDRATAKLATSLETGELLVLDRDERSEARKGVFGFSVRGLEFLESEKGESGSVDKLVSTITSVRMTGRNSYQITIEDNNAVWEIKNVPMRLSPPKSGQKVEFEKAALSSYWVRIDGQNGVKGTRLR